MTSLIRTIKGHSGDFFDINGDGGTKYKLHYVINSDRKAEFSYIGK
jgi:hypothetical protein